MKQVLYLKSDPIQHPGESGRELVMQGCSLFDSQEAERLFTAASNLELFFENVLRDESLNDAYIELMEICSDIQGPDRKRDAAIIRRVRGYILEVDLFLRHWEKYMKRRGEAYQRQYEAITRDAFDGSEAYAMICILRNYLVHSSDVVHGWHIGLDRFEIWTDRDALMEDIDWPRVKRNLIGKQDRHIDLLREIEESLPVVNEVQGKLLDCLVDEQLKGDCKYLVDASKRIRMINGKAWFVMELPGVESAQALPVTGDVPGMGVNYCQLNWKGYQAVMERIEQMERA